MWNFSHRRVYASAIPVQGAGKCDFPDESIPSPVLDTFTVFSFPSPFSDSPAAKQDVALSTLLHPVPPLLAFLGKSMCQLQAEIQESQN